MPPVLTRHGRDLPSQDSPFVARAFYDLEEAARQPATLHLPAQEYTPDCGDGPHCAQRQTDGAADQIRGLLLIRSFEQEKKSHEDQGGIAHYFKGR